MGCWVPGLGTYRFHGILVNEDFSQPRVVDEDSDLLERICLLN